MGEVGEDQGEGDLGKERRWGSCQRRIRGTGEGDGGIEVTAGINGAGRGPLNPGATEGTRAKGIGGMFREDGERRWGNLGKIEVKKLGKSRERMQCKGRGEGGGLGKTGKGNVGKGVV